LNKGKKRKRRQLEEKIKLIFFDINIGGIKNKQKEVSPYFKTNI